MPPDNAGHLPPSFDDKARVCPPPVAINDREFSRQLRMRLDEEGLELPLIRFNLTLEFVILLWPRSWLVAIRHNFIEIVFFAIGTQNCAVEAPLLQPSGVRAVVSSGMLGHRSDLPGPHRRLAPCR